MFLIMRLDKKHPVATHFIGNVGRRLQHPGRWCLGAAQKVWSAAARTKKYPEVKPRIISDNGPRFVARDFKEFIRIARMTHLRTSSTTRNRTKIGARA